MYLSTVQILWKFVSTFHKKSDYQLQNSQRFALFLVERQWPPHCRFAHNYTREELLSSSQSRDRFFFESNSFQSYLFITISPNLSLVF
jgi:hypothetical protein